MIQKSNFVFLRSAILNIGLVLLVVLLQACGGGSDGDDAPLPDDIANKTPAISDVIPDKSSLSFKNNENSSQEVVLSIKYDDQSTSSRTLKVSWSSLAQAFEVEDNAKVKYVVELLSDVTDQSKKILKITEPESKKVFEVSVDMEILPILINQLELISDKIQLNVNESINVNVKVSYNNNEILTSLPDGIACKLQEGDGVITVTDDCNIKGIAPGAAKITLNVAEELLAGNIEIPVMSISVVTPDGGEPVENLPQITKLILTSNKQQLLVGETAELKVSAEFDDTSVEDVTSKVVCEASPSNMSPSITGCRVTVQSAGTIEIGAQLLFSQKSAPVVETIALTFSDPIPKITQVKLNVSNISIDASASSTTNVQLIRSFDVGPDETVELKLDWKHETKTLSVLGVTDNTELASFDLSSFSSGNEVLSIIDPESQLPVSIDVTINFDANKATIDVLKFDAANKQLESGKTYPLIVLATYTDKQIVPVNGLVQCSVDLTDDPIADEKIIITQDCSLQTMFPGTYQINLQLLDQTNASPGIQVEPLTVVVDPVTLGSLATSSEFTVDINVDSPAIALELNNAVIGETYKLVLSSSSSLGILKNFEFHTLSVSQPGVGCFNNSVIGKSSVACGLKASEANILLYIQEQLQNKLGSLKYTISVFPDNDILRSDGIKGNDLMPYEKYEKLTVGTTYSGHVSANAYGLHNTSYYSVDVSNSVNQAGNDYTVTVMFKSPYYSVDSVVVTNDDSDSTPAGSPPLIIKECSYYVDTNYSITPETNSISCKVSNADKPKNIFIEVYGKDLTGVDGEVSYDIIVNQP